MPQLQVKTISSEKVWEKGDLAIFKLLIEWEGQEMEAKTYSRAIASPGWSGTVETYEKEGRRGAETFIKQPQQEGFQKGGFQKSSPQASKSYTPKDEKAIQAMWSIGQAVTWLTQMKEDGTTVADIKPLAIDIFSMVDEVKASIEVTPEKQELDKVFGETEAIGWKNETPQLPV